MSERTVPVPLDLAEKIESYLYGRQIAEGGGSAVPDIRSQLAKIMSEPAAAPSPSPAGHVERAKATIDLIRRGTATADEDGHVLFTDSLMKVGPVFLAAAFAQVEVEVEVKATFYRPTGEADQIASDAYGTGQSSQPSPAVGQPTDRDHEIAEAIVARFASNLDWPRLRKAIASALTSSRQAGWDAGIEAAAKEFEGHLDDNPWPGVWSAVAARIRSLKARGS